MSYADGVELTPELQAMLRKQATKRIALQFVPEETATWDHRKLTGTY